MQNQMKKDDLLDIEEASIKLLDCIKSIFEDSTPPLFLSALNLTVYTLLKEFQRGTKVDLLDTHINCLRAFENAKKKVQE
jgi:hypothetical protein